MNLDDGTIRRVTDPLHDALAYLADPDTYRLVAAAVIVSADGSDGVEVRAFGVEELDRAVGLICLNALAEVARDEGMDPDQLTTDDAEVHSD